VNIANCAVLVPAWHLTAQREVVPTRARRGRRGRCNPALAKRPCQSHHVKSDDLALRVAIASAGFSAGALVWQLCLYRLSGARLIVRLLPVVQDAALVVGTGPDRGWERVRDHLSTLEECAIDLAEVRVTNVGRSPVSVSDLSLDFGRAARWRKGRMTMRGFPVALLDGTTETVIRLDAGSTTSQYFDLWTLVDAMREKKPGKTIDVRASAVPAGRRPQRSRRRARWRFEPGRRSLRPDYPETSAVRAYRELWRLNRADEGRASFTSTVWSVIYAGLKRGDSVDLIAEQVESVLGTMSSWIVTRVVAAYEQSPDSDDPTGG
jgi:hypothetical protein